MAWNHHVIYSLGYQDMSKEAEKNLTPKQCAVLDMALGTVKDYFFASGNTMIYFIRDLIWL